MLYRKYQMKYTFDNHHLIVAVIKDKNVRNYYYKLYYQVYIF